MSAIGNLVVNFMGNAKPLQGTLASVRDMVGGFHSTIAGLLGAGVSILAAKEDTAAQKKLQAVLTATGYAAGLTAGNIRELATDLQNTTNFADETTVAAAAVLATFKSIKGDEFKNTLTTAQDIATVFDMDLTSATMKLGKALQDPVQGIGSLHKVGISFTEDQKKLIKTLVESGDKMGAQKYILDALKGSFGGAAAAMASPFKILQNQIGEIGEEIGKSLLLPMKSLASFLIPFIKEWGQTIAKVATAVIVVVGAYKAWQTVQKGVAIGQALILSLSGPAGWAKLAAGAAIFTGALVLVNSQFGEMQKGLDATQAEFAGVAQEAARFAKQDAAWIRQLGDKPQAEQKGDEKKREELVKEFSPKHLRDQLAEAGAAFGGEQNLPWFVREGITEKFTGVSTTIAKLKTEMRMLNGVTQSQIDIENLWKADNGVSVEKKKEIEALIRQRDELGKTADAMKEMKNQAKSIFEETRTPIEKMETKIAEVNKLFAAGLIDATTRDRAIAKANEDALGKDKPELGKTGADVAGSSAAFSNIFTAMQTAGNTAQDKIADATERTADAAEEAEEQLQEIATNTRKFAGVEFIARVV